MLITVQTAMTFSIFEILKPIKIKTYVKTSHPHRNQ